MLMELRQDTTGAWMVTGCHTSLDTQTRGDYLSRFKHSVWAILCYGGLTQSLTETLPVEWPTPQAVTGTLPIPDSSAVHHTRCERCVPTLAVYRCSNSSDLTITIGLITHQLFKQAHGGFYRQVSQIRHNH